MLVVCDKKRFCPHKDCKHWKIHEETEECVSITCDKFKTGTIQTECVPYISYGLEGYGNDG